MSELWVNINHPCYEIDLVDRSEWGEHDPRRQGYIPLDELRRVNAAAPDLLAALKAWEEAEAMWEKIRTWEYKTTVRPDDWDALYDEMFAQYTKAKEMRRAAIARAEGL